MWTLWMNPPWNMPWRNTKQFKHEIKYQLGSTNLQFSHWVPFTKEKHALVPLPFQIRGIHVQARILERL